MKTRFAQYAVAGKPYASRKMKFHLSLPLRAIAFCAAFGVIVYGCIPIIRQSSRPSAAFPVMNEKLYLYPVVDSSSLQDFEGWPAEQPIQEILRQHFRKLDRSLMTHFRQREKYGLYEMVEDSLLSSVRIGFVIGKFQFRKDTLSFPIRMTARRLTDKTERSFLFIAAGRYRARSRPKSDVHYLNMLLADFRRHFPFEKSSSVFYRPYEKKEH